MELIQTNLTQTDIDYILYIINYGEWIMLLIVE